MRGGVGESMLDTFLVSNRHNLIKLLYYNIYLFLVLCHQMTICIFVLCFSVNRKKLANQKYPLCFNTILATFNGKK